MTYREFKTQAALDAAYDVEASVPDFGLYARMFTDASDTARRRLNHAAGVKYGPTKAEYADIFPSATPGAPVLVFIHGGYWRILSAREFSYVATGFVPAGVTVVVANYDLCPAVSITEITRQMRALTAWCAANIQQYNGDPENITICGHSAGGHLAAMCALTDWQGDYGLPARTLRAIAPISGIFDLEPIALTKMQPDLRITGAEIATCSPQHILRPVPVHMWLSWGQGESSEFARQSADFADAWRKAGNRTDICPQPGRNHFTAITDLGDPGSNMVRALLSLMQHSPRIAPPRRGGVDRRLFPQGALR